MRWMIVCVLAMICALSPVSAQVAAAGNAAVPARAAPERVGAPPVVAGPDTVVDLDTVVVSGVQPGPGMWKVSKGDHVLYVLGTLSPLPKHMEWLSGDVEKIIAQAQGIIASPGVVVSSDIGMFRSLLLVPSMFKARKNPDGKALQEVLPADLYARWQVLKPRYIGSDRGIEKWRPIFAAQALYEAAMRKSGLDQRSVVQPVVKAAAKRHGIAITPAIVKLVVKDPKSALKEFNHGTLADTDCFAKTMARIEGDLEAMRARANAWAVGDIETLRALPYQNQYTACMNAVAETGLAQKLGVGDLPKRVAEVWLGAAEAALAKNQVTFAALPISELLKSDGYLAALRAKGYAVEAP